MFGGGGWRSPWVLKTGHTCTVLQSKCKFSIQIHIPPCRSSSCCVPIIMPPSPQHPPWQNSDYSSVLAASHLLKVYCSWISGQVPSPKFLTSYWLRCYASWLSLYALQTAWGNAPPDPPDPHAPPDPPDPHVFMCVLLMTYGTVSWHFLLTWGTYTHLPPHWESNS